MGVYDYHNKAILSLQMRIGEHDATNLRTLDVSPSGIHAGWTAGATAPTKIGGQRGYSFDGGDYFTGATREKFNVSAISLCMLFAPSFDANDGAAHYLYDTSDAARIYLVKEAGGVLSAGLGNVTPAISFALVSYQNYWKRNQYNAISLVGTSGDNTAMLNGAILGTSVTAWNATNPANYWIGARFNITALFVGNFYSFEVYPIRMTQIQMADWQFNALRRCNDV